MAAGRLVIMRPDTGARLELAYAPEKLSRSRKVTWTPDDEEGADESSLVWKHGDPRELSFEFVLDATVPPVAAGGVVSVQAALDFLEALTDAAGGDRPPLCGVIWSKTFLGVLETLSYDITVLDPVSLEPLRARVSVGFKRFRQTAGQS